MGPLVGIKIIEIAGIGPGPMCAMMFADMGAKVLRIERLDTSGVGVERPVRFNLTLRGRESIALDLKSPEAVELVLKLVAQSDGLIEGFRPGVMERLGLGPDVCLDRNPKLVYGRITGWGQDGPLRSAAGHDLNYIALTGALHATGRAGQPPTFPLNLLGDFAGGTMYLAFGMLCALLESTRSGKGQVVDAAIVDGVASLMTFVHGFAAAGLLNEQRGTNLIDSGAPFYDVYECSDGRWISIAPMENKFFDELLRRLEIDAASVPKRMDRQNWPALREILVSRFLERTQEDWCALLEGTDACFAPVLSMSEAPGHKHLRERNTYIDLDGVTQPAPAPRFSRSKPDLPNAPKPAATDASALIEDWLAAR